MLRNNTLCDVRVCGSWGQWMTSLFMWLLGLNWDGKWPSPALISLQPAWSMNCPAVPRPLPIVSKEWGPFYQCGEGHSTSPTVFLRLGLDPQQGHWTVPSCSLPKSLCLLISCGTVLQTLVSGRRDKVTSGVGYTLMSGNSDPSLTGCTVPPMDRVQRQSDCG